MMTNTVFNIIGSIATIGSLVFQVFVFLIINKKFSFIKLFKKECQIDLSKSDVYDDCGNTLISCLNKYSFTTKYAEYALNFDQIQNNDEKGNYAGVVIKDFDFYNWAKFCNKKGKLTFSYELERKENIEYQIEVDVRNKGYKKESTVYKTEKNQADVEVMLKDISKDKDLWRNIGEICIVFKPKSSSYKGSIILRDMKIIKE